MANIRNGNTFYIDTQYSVASDELAIKGVRVPFLFYSSTAANNFIVLVDSVTNVPKIRIQNLLNNGSLGDTKLFDFHENPILFPNGIKPLSLTNSVVTCIIIDPRA